MTDEELAEIAARADAATAGPWYVVFTDDDSAMNAVYVGTEDRGSTHDNEQGLTSGYSERSREIVAVTLHQRLPSICHESELWDENAEFIAHARDDIPKLVAEVQRLRDALAHAVRRHEQDLEEIRRLRDENDRLGSLLATANYWNRRA